MIFDLIQAGDNADDLRLRRQAERRSFRRHVNGDAREAVKLDAVIDDLNPAFREIFVGD